MGNNLFINSHLLRLNTDGENTSQELVKKNLISHIISIDFEIDIDDKEKINVTFN